MIVSQVIKDQKEVVEGVFITFAEFYKYPTKEFYEEISTGVLDQFLNEAFQMLNIDMKINFQQELPSLEVLQQNFMNCFSGIVTPFYPPVESVYKVWTEDSTAQVSIAKRKGYLMGDSAMHMRHLLQQYNIKVPEGYENMPDHLTILLEFAAFLYMNTEKQHVSQFVNDHLDWLNLFNDSLRSLSDSNFYIYITEVLRQFVTGLFYDRS